MLLDKIAKELYENYCNDAQVALESSMDYKKASELVRSAMKEVRSTLPKDKEKLYFELENGINYRENITAKEAYKHAFMQGAKFVLELLSSNK